MRFISKFTCIQFSFLLFQELLKVASCCYKWKSGERGGLSAAKTPRMREARTSSLSARVRKAGRLRPLVVRTGSSCSPGAWGLPYCRAVTLTSHLRRTKALRGFSFESLLDHHRIAFNFDLMSFESYISWHISNFSNRQG